MEQEQIIKDAQFLRAVVNAGSVTKEDKKELTRIANGLELKVANASCKSCWIDLAVLCWQKLQDTQKEVLTGGGVEDSKEKGRWGVRPGLDVYFLGQRVNECTITDALAENLLAKGFPRKFLVENEGGN